MPVSDTMTVKELRQMATKASIPGRSKMDKKELIRALKVVERKKPATKKSPVKKPTVHSVKDTSSYQYKTNVEDSSHVITVRENIQEGLDDGVLEIYETYIPVTIDGKLIKLPLHISLVGDEGDWSDSIICSAYFPEGYSSKWSTELNKSIGDVMIVYEKFSDVVILQELHSDVYDSVDATLDEKKGLAGFGHKLLCFALKFGVRKKAWKLKDPIKVNIMLGSPPKLVNYYRRVGFNCCDPGTKRSQLAKVEDVINKC